MTDLKLELIMTRLKELDLELKALLQRQSSVEHQLKNQNRFLIAEEETSTPPLNLSPGQTFPLSTSQNQSS